MNQDQELEAKAKVLLQEQQRHEQWLRDAGRPYTKNLFGLWLLLIIGICVLIFATFLHEGFSLLVSVSMMLMLLVLVTGAYVFQEVARVHRRIDAILKLLEREAKK